MIRIIIMRHVHRWAILVFMHIYALIALYMQACVHTAFPSIKGVVVHTLPCIMIILLS